MSIALRTPLYSGRRFTISRVAGLKLWLRADAGTWQDSALTTPAAADADRVGGWVDQSSQAVNELQATAGLRGTLKTAGNGLNGLPIVRFAGASSQVLSAASNPPLEFDQTDSWLVVVVARIPNTINDGDFINKLSPGATGRGWRVYYLTQKPTIQLINDFGLGNRLLASGGTTINDNVARVYSFRYSGNSNTSGCSISLNGVAESMTSVTNSLSGTTLGNTPALVGGSTNYLTGDLAEIVVVSPAPSAAIQKQIEKDAGGRRGITVT